MNGPICGQDAIDLAKMSGVQLCRVPCKVGDPPDTSWQAAEEAIADGDDIDYFFLDLDNITPDDAGKIILAMTGMFRAWTDAVRKAALADRVGILCALMKVECLNSLDSSC